MGMFGTCQGRGLPGLWHKSYHRPRPPPPCQWPGPCFFFREGGGGLGWVGLDSPDLKNATDPSIEKFGSPGSGAIIGVV